LPCESLWDGFANTNRNGNGYRDGNGYSNDDSSSVAHAYSDGATTDNTYTTAPSNAAAAPVALFGMLTRELAKRFASSRRASKVERVVPNALANICGFAA